MQMNIIDPVDPALIEAELTPDRFMRDTNKAGNKIYVVTAENDNVLGVITLDKTHILVDCVCRSFIP